MIKAVPGACPAYRNTKDSFSLNIPPGLATAAVGENTACPTLRSLQTCITGGRTKLHIETDASPFPYLAALSPPSKVN